MVIWSLQVAIRGTVSLTAYKTQLKGSAWKRENNLR